MNARCLSCLRGAAGGTAAAPLKQDKQRAFMLNNRCLSDAFLFLGRKVGQLVQSVFKLIDKTRFEIFCFMSEGHDNSQVCVCKS